MWQNPYSPTYNPLAGFPTGQTNLNLFNPSGVITPPPNAAPFPTQPDIPVTPPVEPVMLQPALAEQMGQMVVTAFDNFKKSIVDTKEDGTDMLLTVRIPTQILKQDPNFGFLFNK